MSCLRSVITDRWIYWRAIDVTGVHDGWIVLLESVWRLDVYSRHRMLENIDRSANRKGADIFGLGLFSRCLYLVIRSVQTILCSSNSLVILNNESTGAK